MLEGLGERLGGWEGPGTQEQQTQMFTRAVVLSLPDAETL